MLKSFTAPGMAASPPPSRSLTNSSSSISSACAVNRSVLARNSEPPPTIAPSLISSPGTATRSMPFLTFDAAAMPLPRINQLR
ncbi:ferredoxin-dependent glutamate synthase [Pyrus ussuriensis x Pyrus communis]|uniref:Ferredoxin-dependent glutamate synthase n=1 Tax=Pyrus ussuriensis x Pyrus communis TaxID=2448454 RepID=A0A5N5FFY6_9ROSA|nr:ferredoxin-dependent glutamate synthase [Pyrus ussuriensis x Pyrus communis]